MIPAPTVKLDASIKEPFEEMYLMLESALLNGSYDPKTLPEEIKDAILATMATIDLFVRLIANAENNQESNNVIQDC